jgi:putative sigma-54 modulation protein
MQVIVESRHVQGNALRSVAENRLRFVLRRLAWLVPRARLRLSDANGPRGGVDKQVQVELQLIGVRPVIVSATSRDWRAAIDTAVGRAARRMVRSYRRARQSGPARPLDLAL